VRRQYFSNLPILLRGANIFQIRLIFRKAQGICLIFVAANICVYFQYLLMHLSMRQYFWRNCFALKFKIDIAVMIM
jgi:hypothetical protein